MFTIPFTKAAREKKEAKAVLSAARTFVLSYEDLESYRTNADFQALRESLEAKDTERCKDILALLDPPKSFALGREWLDILVVSISVAMAFRAYFYEPFNIPTGSMQPTLYGNHSVEAKATDAKVWDKVVPLSWVKWLITGETFRNFKAPFGGTLVFRPTNTGYYEMTVQNPALGKVSSRMMVPTDVLHPTETGDGPYKQRTLALPNGLMPGSVVKAGQSLWCGRVKIGDFLFVNRWLWNFRHPRRGDVMIFSTTGIPNLQQGTHYIKRMVGLPGESLSIKAPKLFVNGKEVSEPLRIRQISNREKFAPWAYPYDGFRVSGAPSYSIPGKTLVAETDVVKLGADEYYACGDNSPSSYDSRYWGTVPARNLRGIAGGVFWPFTSPRWGVIK